MWPYLHNHDEGPINAPKVNPNAHLIRPTNSREREAWERAPPMFGIKKKA